MDGVIVGRVSLPLELTGQGIRLDIVGPRTVGEGKVKPGKEEGLAGLAGIEPLGRANVFEVLVISPYQKWDLGPLQPLPPLLQLHLNRQQFPISNVIISFSWRQAKGEKGTGMELVVGGRALGKHGPHTNI